MDIDSPENWRYSEEKEYDEIADKGVRRATISRKDTDVSVAIAHGSGADGYCYHVFFRMYEHEYKNEIIGSASEFRSALDLATIFVDDFEAQFRGGSGNDILALADRVIADHEDLETDHGFSLV